MENAEPLRNRLRQLRKKNPKLTQAEAATIAGVSDRMWYAFEKGEATPRLEALERFAINREISLNELLSGERIEQHDMPWEIDIPIVDHIPAGPLIQGFGESGIIGSVRSDVRDPEAFALVVKGSSMSPEIQEDDIVVFSPRTAYVNGKIYAVVVGDGEQSLKRVRFDQRSKAYALIPTNKEFPTLYVPEDQVVRLVRLVKVLRDYQ